MFNLKRFVQKLYHMLIANFCQTLLQKIVVPLSVFVLELLLRFRN